jgi:hypothetical protein
MEGDAKDGMEGDIWGQREYVAIRGNSYLDRLFLAHPTIIFSLSLMTP